MPAFTISRLTEILNGTPTTQAELHGYLSPDAKVRFHVDSAVEARLRELLQDAIARDAQWQETLAGLSRPWREELLEIEAAGRGQILSHATHAGDARCNCWREPRAAYYAAIDRWADCREAVADFEGLWDELVLLSETHRPPKDDDTAAAIIAGVADAVEEQIASSVRDALPFLGTRRNRR